MSDPCKVNKHIYPKCVKDLQSYPLYIAVALWGMRTNNLLTTDVVSREFMITQRTASDIIHYIEYKGCRYIKSIRYTQQVTGCYRRRSLRITHVKLPPLNLMNNKRSFNKQDEVVHHKNKNTKPITKTNVQQLRQWMVSRKVGDKVPNYLIITS